MMRFTADVYRRAPDARTRGLRSKEKAPQRAAPGGL